MGRWPIMRGISPGVDVLQTADVTLWAASRRRRQWLPARHPRRRRPSDVMCRRWPWLSSDALERSENSWSRECTPAMPGVVHSIWNVIKISNKTPEDVDIWYQFCCSSVDWANIRPPYKFQIKLRSQTEKNEQNVETVKHALQPQSAHKTKLENNTFA